MNPFASIVPGARGVPALYRHLLAKCRLEMFSKQRVIKMNSSFHLCSRKYSIVTKKIESKKIYEYIIQTIKYFNIIIQSVIGRKKCGNKK